jgi:putative DNA primase/helicase
MESHVEQSAVNNQHMLAGQSEDEEFLGREREAIQHENDEPISNFPVPDYRKGRIRAVPANLALVNKWLKTADPNGIHLTDTGNAKILATQHRKYVRYCKQIGWFVWDGKRWLRDDTESINCIAKQTVLNCYTSLADVVDQRFRERVFKHLQRSESAKGITSMLTLAQSEPGISISVGQLDQDQYLLNVLNGTLNLNTGKLQKRRRGDHITRLAPVKYDPQAQCPRFKQFLGEIFQGKQDLIRFVRQYLGYCLTGSTQEQCFAIFYGSGANGKSTLCKTVQRILGDYASQSPVETFIVKSGAGIRNDIARLHSARTVFASESEDGQRLAESLIKQLTGGDRMSARFLHREYFEFEPRFKLILSTNHRPTIRGTDQAIWRRIQLVPFNVAFTPQQQDKGLLEKLWEERDGIFAWMLEGLQDWQKDGLITPDEVAEATQDYREDQDVIGHFMEECVDEKMYSSIPCKSLYNIYVWWAKNGGEYAQSYYKFKSAMTERGITRSRTTACRKYHNIAVRPEVEAEYRKDGHEV